MHFMSFSVELPSSIETDRGIFFSFRDISTLKLCSSWFSSLKHLYIPSSACCTFFITRLLPSKVYFSPAATVTLSFSPSPTNDQEIESSSSASLHTKVFWPPIFVLDKWGSSSSLAQQLETNMKQTANKI